MLMWMASYELKKIVQTTLFWSWWFLNLLSNNVLAAIYAGQAWFDIRFKNHWLSMQNCSHMIQQNNQEPLTQCPNLVRLSTISIVVVC